MSRTVSIAFGALVACAIAYVAWRALATQDAEVQGRQAVRSARRAARAAATQVRHAVHRSH